MREAYYENKKISEAGVPDNVLIIAIERNGEEIIPKGKTIILEGDTLLTIILEGDTLFFLIPENLVAELKEELIKKATC